ncbi:MAG TPA: PadR family transcriptional regulator [Cyclobacteriaceae bacterium]|nr:PadR family transcriptional regulator [Cyclobacteriaceae bacterium]
MLGEFEEIVLLAVGVLHGNAYGVTIKQEIELRSKREISVGALQVTLRRLEKKGFLSSKHAPPDTTRGGRPKLYFTLTAYGKKTLQQTLEIRVGFWKSLPEAILKMS